MGRMTGKVALITGAARGQGRAHALRLAEEGADIIALDICAQLNTVQYPMATPDDLDQTRLLVEQTGRRILPLVVDVRDRQAVKDGVDEGLREFGHIDVACINHGIMNLVSALDMTEEEWRDTIDVNLTGVFNTVQAVLPTMFDSGTGGSIIMTSSVAALRGYANNVHYSSAKAGMLGMMTSLVNEVSDHGIRVNCVLPGSIATPMIQNDFVYNLFNPQDPTRDQAARVFRTMNRLPVDWLESREVSNAVLFLASDESRFITGVSLPVDAGLSVKI